jgi:hypothetical protein
MSGAIPCILVIAAAGVAGCGSVQPTRSFPPPSRKRAARVGANPTSGVTYRAIYDHVLDGKHDVVVVDVAPDRFRMSARYPMQSTSSPESPVTLIVNGRALAICASSLPGGCKTKTLPNTQDATNVASLYQGLPTPPTLRVLYRSIASVGEATALGQPTRCFHAVSKLDGSPLTYCALASNGALADLNAASERWTLTSISAFVPSSAFAIP